MWKPAEVLPEHRKRAVVLWLAFVVCIIAYMSWLIYWAVETRKSPSTSVVLSNDVYKYPDLMVCLYDFFGCDALEKEGECISSYNTTEGGASSATFNPGMDSEQAIDLEVGLTDEKGYCATFYTSSIEMDEEERDPEDYILIEMYWYPGGNNVTSTTCIEEDGEWESHSESVFVFLKDSDTGDLSSGVQVAYSCMTSMSDRHIFNYMGIGLTQDNKLDGSESTATYKALTTSTSTYKDKRDDTITGIIHPFAYLALEVAQDVDSLVVITEVDPLAVAEIFGQVGGAWDLLLMLWPIFFIAAAREDPHLKLRNFRKTIMKGKNLVHTTAPRPTDLPDPVECTMPPGYGRGSALNTLQDVKDDKDRSEGERQRNLSRHVSLEDPPEV